MWQYYRGQDVTWQAVIVASAMFHLRTIADRMPAREATATSHRRRAAHPATSMCWRRSSEKILVG